MAEYLTNIEKRMAGAEVDAAIERWEDEGGRTLAPEESLSARSGDLAPSDHQVSFAARSPARAMSSS